MVKDNSGKEQRRALTANTNRDIKSKRQTALYLPWISFCIISLRACITVFHCFITYIAGISCRKLVGDNDFSRSNIRTSSVEIAVCFRNIAASSACYCWLDTVIQSSPS